MNRLDVILQVVTLKRPDFGDVLKKYAIFFRCNGSPAYHRNATSLLNV
jgi:hypothetical protein